MIFTILGILVLGMGLELTSTVLAEETLIPFWIKTTAGFWVNDQISDAEFMQALQFLVESKILTIPDKDTLNDIVSQKTITPTSPQSSEITYDEYTPHLSTFYMEGANVGMVIDILDFNGNPISEINGELHVQILDFDDEEIFKQKIYLVSNSFSTLTNEISDEEVIGFKFLIQKGKIKVPIIKDDLYANGLGTLILSLTIKDKVYSSETLLDHLPIGEGFFNKDTGFIKKYDVDQSLKISNFFVKVRDVGYYIGEDLADNKKLKNYFKMNLNTKSSDVSGFTFTLDEAYLEDSQGNVYVSDPISIDNYVNSFLGESFEYEGGNGFLLFEEIPFDTSELKFTVKISRIDMDGSQTQFEDEMQFSLN